ncbi:MAG: VOC family protein [Hyphomicrobiales bacterium]|nr:VOC family protein [Hyphomicrobiales bacterium]
MTTSPFVWYELSTTDMAAARGFYGAVLGWGADDMNMPGMPYTVVKAGDVPIGGIMNLPDHLAQACVPPHWIAYMACDDVDATAKAMQADGATIHLAPTDIPNVGRFAVMADPAGAHFNLFKPLPGDGPVPERYAPGTVGWRELYTSDLAGSLAFYGKYFGLTKLRSHDMGAMGSYEVFGYGGEQLGGMMDRPPQVPVSTWGFVFTVIDIEEAAARVTASGGKVLMGPMEVPGGQKTAKCLDPQGASFSMVTQPQAAA